MDTSTDTRWAPRGTGAVHVWLCGRCSTELVRNDDDNSCEVCGCRYHTETGAFLDDDEI